ncbi:hypothetical protein [Ancylobacter oerskovii]|uniref:Right handed beta helix domain-containing protein n=1 Tax=Ancylobacter oerskovii TaxID=459519 RepID=A0ABW4Z1H5_9HYPH|nr:hypothetical protein [Ancylobacter oerskovii]MBS7542549.1 hypothetical protein [Ancylobacter oerskovii]
MTTAFFPTLVEAQSAGAPTPLPDYVHVLDYDAPGVGVGGEAIYALQKDAEGDPLTMDSFPPFGSTLFANGTFSSNSSAGWTLGAGVTVSSNRLNGLNSSKATTTLELIAGRRYRLSWNCTRDSSTYAARVYPNGYSSSDIVLVANAGSGPKTVEIVPSITGTWIFEVGGEHTGFIGWWDNFTCLNMLDQGYVQIFGYAYLPMPLESRDGVGGYLRPEMFRLDTTGAGYDDDAFTRMFLRAQAIGGDITIKLRGRYRCRTPRQTLTLPKGASITIDGEDSGHIDLRSGTITEAVPWLILRGPGYTGNTKTYVIAPVIEGATSIMVNSATGIQPGDWVAITSTHQYYIGVPGVSGYAVAFRGEKMQVWKVEGNKVTFATGTILSYDLAADPVANPVNVRVVDLGGTCAIKGISATGPGDGKSEGNKETETAAIGFISASYFEHMKIHSTRCENFKGSSINLSFYGFGTISDATTLGSRLGDPSNVTPTKISQRFYGLQLQGAGPTTASNINGEYCRRALDCGFMNFQGSFIDAANSSEGVITQQVVVTGGISKRCETAPSGHECHEFSLIGHRAHDVDGLTIRGKHYHISDLVMVSSGGIGIGGVVPANPASYSEDPIAGNISLNNIELYGGGIRSRVGFESLSMQNVKVRDASNPVWLTGKHQSNVRIVDCDLQGTGGQPVIWLQYPIKFDGSNITIRNNRLAGGSYGMLHEGAVEIVKNIDVSGNTFEGISSSYVKLDPLGGDWASDGSLRFQNNRVVGSLLSVPIDASGLVLNATDNQWGTGAVVVEPSSGTIQLPDLLLGPTIRVRAKLSAATTVTSIVGAKDGQLVQVLLDSGSSPLTLAAEGGNLISSADVVLNNLNDTALFVAHGASLILLAKAEKDNVSGNFIAGQSSVPITLTGTTAQTVLASVNIPANSLRPNDSIRVTSLWSHDSSANVKTMKVRFGPEYYSNISATTTVSSRLQVQIYNREKDTDYHQVTAPAGLVAFGPSYSGVLERNVSTNTIRQVTLTGTLASIDGTITLEAYTVEVIRA